jgi:hypothetical protein
MFLGDIAIKFPTLNIGYFICLSPLSPEGGKNGYSFVFFFEFVFIFLAGLPLSFLLFFNGIGESFRFASCIFIFFYGVGET